MFDSILGSRRVRQIQRAFRHGKITVLCLLMTVVVLRGTIGAGKFGTPGQDFIEIRDHLYSRKRSEPHRVLKEAESTESTESTASTNSYADFDLAKLMKDEEEDEKPDPNKPYTLGPKISDWDEQRANWLSQNPGFSNFIAPNKPRVLLVTGSSPKPCENPIGDHYLLKSIAVGSVRERLLKKNGREEDKREMAAPAMEVVGGRGRRLHGGCWRKRAATSRRLLGEEDDEDRFCFIKPPKS